MLMMSWLIFPLDAGNKYNNWMVCHVGKLRWADFILNKTVVRIMYVPGCGEWISEEEKKLYMQKYIQNLEIFLKII